MGPWTRSSVDDVLRGCHAGVLVETRSYTNWALEAAVSNAAVANYLDHIDHNEDVDREWLWDAGRTFRRMACEIAAAEELDLLSLYVGRLRMIEQRNPLFHPGAFDGAQAAGQVDTWRGLQLAQSDHDRYYHPDVLGLSKLDQLRHYSLHLSKLVGALAEAATAGPGQEFLERRLPDLLLFGVKLATVTGKALPETDLSRSSAERQRELIAA